MKRLIICLIFLGLSVVAGATEKLNVLIITGKNNHNWEKTTAALKQGMKDCGRFDVEVTLKPEEITAESIAKYDVLVSNWTNFPRKERWGPVAEKAVEKFVKNGKGLTAFHAGGSSMQDWDAFQEIVSGAWGKGTGHGPRGLFTVKMTDVQHPITKGLKSFDTTDELWCNLAVLKPVRSRKVLATAYSTRTKKDEDIAVCTEYGKGRGFFLVLGHDAEGVSNTGTMQLLLRGVEWAATGKVAVELKAVSP